MPLWLQFSCESGETPYPTTGAAIAIVRGHMVVFGGHSMRYRQEDRLLIPTDNVWSNQVFLLNLSSLVWNEVRYEKGQNRPSPRDKCCSWEHKNLFYVFGGYGPGLKERDEIHEGEFLSADDSDEKVWNNQLLSFDIKTRSWLYVKTSRIGPTARAAAASFQNKNILFLFGGRQKETRLNDLYSLDMNSLVWNRWDMENTGDLIGRSWCSISVTEDNTRLYVWGGHLTGDWETLTDEILVGDLIKKRWSRLEKAANPRFWHSGAYNDGVIYVMGGSCAEDQYLDPFVEHRRVQPASLRNIAFNALDLNKLRIGDCPEKLADKIALRSLLQGSPK